VFFTQGQATQFIEKVFGNGKPSNQGLNISVVCPICKSFKSETFSKQKLVIRTDNFMLHCWSCGYKARNLVFLLRKYKPFYLQEYIEGFLGDAQLLKLSIEEKVELGLEDANEAPPRLPEGFQMLATCQSSSKYVKSHLEYLHNRGIALNNDDSELWYWKIGIVPWDDKDLKYRIIIPSFDADGYLNYWTARTINPKSFLRYKNPENKREPIIFNELNIDWSKELLIVEGPMDLIKTKDANENATCLMGSELSSDYRLFEKIVVNKTPVVICLDPDASKKQYRIAQRLHEFGNEVKIIDLPNDIEDVGSLSTDQFTHIYSTAIDYSEDYILRMKINSLQE